MDTREPTPERLVVRDVEDLHRNVGREVVLEGDVSPPRKGLPEIVLDSGVVVTLIAPHEAEIMGRRVSVAGVIDQRKIPPSDAQRVRPPIQTDKPSRDALGRPDVVFRVRRVLQSRPNAG